MFVDKPAILAVIILARQSFPERRLDAAAIEMAHRVEGISFARTKKAAQLSRSQRGLGEEQILREGDASR